MNDGDIIASVDNTPCCELPNGTSYKYILMHGRSRMGEQGHETWETRATATDRSTCATVSVGVPKG